MQIVALFEPPCRHAFLFKITFCHLSLNACSKWIVGCPSSSQRCQDVMSKYFHVYKQWYLKNNFSPQTLSICSNHCLKDWLWLLWYSRLLEAPPTAFFWLVWWALPRYQIIRSSVLELWFGSLSCFTRKVVSTASTGYGFALPCGSFSCPQTSHPLFFTHFDAIKADATHT